LFYVAGSDRSWHGGLTSELVRDSLLRFDVHWSV
jgi:hypothetical protein